MDTEAFRKIVEDAVVELPETIRAKLDNVDIVIEDGPVDRRGLLGLYQGVPLKKRGVWYGNVLPDKITLFKMNIERVSRDHSDMKEWVRRVLIHEIGHYFGFDEQELRKLSM
jgi:predicted Zn-dependent protease with MMP-like domain